MATKTTNLGLTKPALTDNADITVFNANMDLIDSSFTGKANTPVSDVQDIKIISTSPQTLATYTPSVNGNYEIRAYLRVLNTTTNVSIAVTYNDVTGPQTKYMLFQANGLFFPCSNGIKSYSVGSYVMIPLFITAVAGSPITVSVLSGTANQAYVSCAIVGV